MFDFEKVLGFLHEHKGKVIGILIGLLVAILILSFGFLRTFFIVLCCFIGALIGKGIDDREGLQAWIKKLFKDT